jgi:hypothetical protein
MVAGRSLEIAQVRQLDVEQQKNHVSVRLWHEKRAWRIIGNIGGD